MMKSFIVFLLLLATLSVPTIASAHEVYVLTAQQIDSDLHVTSLNVFASLSSTVNLLWFLFFASSAITSLSISFIFSFSRWGISIANGIKKLSKFALPIVRVVFGVSLIYSAHFGSLFGPELSLSQLPGAYMWPFVLYACGILVIFGLFTRIVAAVLLTLFLTSVLVFHEYMLTYVNYLGEILVLLLVGGEAYSLDKVFFKKYTFSPVPRAQTWAIPILRISFAISLLYAALYVKFLHPALTYEVALQYHMDKFFPFDPLFVVLGAGCVEVVIAMLFLLGINMRWNILFFAFWATLSLLFFGEAVWPHYILFGISTGLFLYGYDKYTLENWLVNWTKKRIKK
jgi:uncharacterized membrane protein YphA (DoxX/SURF4 family)